MTTQRMDHVGVVVDDLAAAVAFLAELGLEVQDEGSGSIEGRWVDRRRTSVSESTSSFHAPAAVIAESTAPNTLGIRRTIAAVDDVDDVVGRLRVYDAELVGEVAQYEEALLCPRPRRHHCRVG